MKDIAAELLPGERDLERHATLRPGEFWAVDDVSFELRRGECLGLIGRNGAGKTTLLKMLNGLIKPDKGRIEIRGRVGALIALGAGFNPILTGRENIYVNASILGRNRNEIDDQLDEIIAFADLDGFIDSPVQSYSSGMIVRLGFAVAIASKPDVLIIDEILAVGDAAFRSKCYGSIHDIAGNAAVIFVSHFGPHLARLCTKAIVLERGLQSFSGSVGSALNFYQKAALPDKAAARHGSGEIRVESLTFRDRHNRAVRELSRSQPVNIEVVVNSSVSSRAMVLDIAFRTTDDQVAAEINNFVTPFQILSPDRGRAVINICVPTIDLNPGVYVVSAFVMSDDMLFHYDWIDPISQITVSGPRSGIASYQASATWSITCLPKPEEHIE
jgi:lipopolysaccharide transport system ATP-binding protein